MLNLTYILSKLLKIKYYFLEIWRHMANFTLIPSNVATVKLTIIQPNHKINKTFF